MTSKEFFKACFAQSETTESVQTMFKTLMNELCNSCNARQEEIKSGKKKTVSKKTADVKTIKTETKKTEPKKVEPKKTEPKKSAAKTENTTKTTPDVEAIRIPKRTVCKLGLEYVDYSEKSFVVFGDTKPIKDELKKLTGRFNGRLTINGKTQAGWVFAKRNAEPVLKSLYLTA